MSKGAKKMNFSLRKVFPMQTLRPVQSPELTFEKPTQCTPINPALGERRAPGFAGQPVQLNLSASISQSEIEEDTQHQFQLTCAHSK